MSDDIVDAIARFRVAFLSQNLKPPTAILLESHEEGMRIVHALEQGVRYSYVIGHQSLGNPVKMADGCVYMELDIMGMKVRWPANRHAMPDGSWKYA